MEEFIHEMNRLCEQKRGLMEYECQDIIRSYRPKLINLVIGVLEDSFRSFRSSQYEDYIDEYLVYEISKRLNDLNDRNFDNIRSLNSSIENISHRKPLDSLPGYMEYDLNELRRRLNPEAFFDIIDEFVSNLTRKLMGQYLGSNEPHLDDTLYEIKRFLSARLRRQVEDLFDEYTTSLSKMEIETYLKEFNRGIDRLKQEQEEKEETNEVSFQDIKDQERLIILSGIDLIDTEKGMKIVHPYTKRLEPLITKREGVYGTKDDTIEIDLSIPKRVRIKRGNDVIVFDGIILTFGYTSMENNMRLAFDGNNDLHYYYQDNEVSKPVEIGLVLDALKSQFPLLYEQFMQREEFARDQALADNFELETQAFIHEDGNVKLNPKNREHNLELLASCGLEAIEHDDGLYFLVGGKERKAKGDNWITLEGVKDFLYRPNFYIANHGSVTGPFFEFKVGEVRAIIPEDFSAINIYKDDVHYASRIDKTGKLRYFAQHDKTKVCSSEEAKRRIAEMVPKIFAKNVAYVESLQAPDVQDLLDELDEEPKREEKVTDQQTITEQPTVSSELDELMKDPNVKRYLELLNKAKEENIDSPSGPKM